MKKEKKRAEIETEIGVLREAGLLTTQGGGRACGELEMGAGYKRRGGSIEKRGECEGGR